MTNMAILWVRVGDSARDRISEAATQIKISERGFALGWGRASLVTPTENFVPSPTSSQIRMGLHHCFTIVSPLESELELELESDIGLVLEIKLGLELELGLVLELELELEIGIKLNIELELELEHFEAVPLIFETIAPTQIPLTDSSPHALLLTAAKVNFVLNAIKEQLEIF